MKKILAVILSAIMIFCCIPFAASAAETVSGNFTTSNQLQSGVNYVVKSGTTATVPSNLTVYINANSRLTVEAGAKLAVYGSIIVLEGGELYIDGDLEGTSAENIICNGSKTEDGREAKGVAVAQVRFPALASRGLTDKINVSYGVSEHGNSYEDLAGDKDFFKGVDAIGLTTYVPLNQILFVKAAIVEDEPPFDKYDDSKMYVYFNGFPQQPDGACRTAVVTSIDISYSNWVSDEYFLNSFEIYLPSGEGYTVYGRDGEQSANGEIVELTYGMPFAFEVEIDPEYSMSAYEVYVFNGYGWQNMDLDTLADSFDPLQPNEDGFYVIPAVRGETTVYVRGVIKDETILMIGDVLSMVKTIFEMISEFFRQIAEFFGFSAGTPTA